MAHRRLARRAWPPPRTISTCSGPLYIAAKNLNLVLADLPTARSGITAAEVGGRVYVFGSEGGDGTFRENEAYDPARDTWQTMTPMPTGRHGLGSAVVRGRIHVISGGPTPGGSFSNLNEVFIPPEPATSKPEGRAQPDRSGR